ncbi:MAG: extracellular solute-binding protein, partial [Oscillospiraceae bacterium]|nr:extracellular solute-binding protein [Oscillospiraceae bacterium]
EKIATMVMADQSPDIFQFEERFYPYGVFADIFEPIDDVIDLSGKEWDNTRDIIKLFEWGGKNYAPVAQLAPSSSTLFYRRTIINEQGLDDPYDLYKKDEWTWDALFDMCEKFSGKDKYGIMGFYIDEATILSTGTPMIGIEDGKLKSNMDSPEIARATDFLKKLAEKGYRYPYHEIGSYKLNPKEFRSGNILFWNDGVWEYQDKIQKFAKEDNWGDGNEPDFDDVGIVPWPRDPKANDYYQRGKQDAYMLVAGSKNKDGYKAWVQSNVIAAQDEKMDKAGREKMKRDYNYTEKQLDMLKEIEQKLTLRWDFKNGLSPSVCDIDGSPIESLTKPIITEGLDYAQLREENRSIIEKDIELINKSVTN